MEEGPAIGIDLGTTYSCVAVWQDDKAEVIVNEEGNRTTPSYVTFNDTERMIGYAAKSQAALNPENTVFAIHRSIAAVGDGILSFHCPCSKLNSIYPVLLFKNGFHQCLGFLFSEHHLDLRIGTSKVDIGSRSSIKGFGFSDKPQPRYGFDYTLDEYVFKKCRDSKMSFEVTGDVHNKRLRAWSLTLLGLIMRLAMPSLNSITLFFTNRPS